MSVAWDNLLASVKAKHGGGDWRVRLARGRRMLPSDLTDAVIEHYWDRMAASVSDGWLAQRTPEELDWRLTYMQERLLEVDPTDLYEAEEALRLTLMEITRRRPLTGPEAVATKRAAVAELGVAVDRPGEPPRFRAPPARRR